MSTWTVDELAAVGHATELLISTRRSDGGLRAPVPIWVVRVADELYVRSYRGAGGAWYRHARNDGYAHIRAGGVDRDVAVDATLPDETTRMAIDAEYRSKYATHVAYVPPMLTPTAVDTTLRLEPVT